MRLQSTLTCPHCAHQKLETMPTDACQWFYECEGCHTLLKPKAGDCCVFCTYGDVPCPPIQESGSCRELSGEAFVGRPDRLDNDWSHRKAFKT